MPTSLTQLTSLKNFHCAGTQPPKLGLIGQEPDQTKLHPSAIPVSQRRTPSRRIALPDLLRSRRNDSHAATAACAQPATKPSWEPYSTFRLNNRDGQTAAASVTKRGSETTYVRDLSQRKLDEYHQLQALHTACLLYYDRLTQTRVE